MDLVAFSEAPEDLDSAEDADVAGLTRALAEAGARICHLRREFAHEAGTPLLGKLKGAGPAWGVLIGNIPSEARYRSLCDEAKAKGVSMLNTPEQHLDALQLSRGVARLDKLTARSVAVASAAEVARAVQAIGLPVFIKGDIFSRKWSGWDACVARTLEQAQAITAAVLKVGQLARERALVREILPLKRSGDSYEGFPLAREYRVFCLDGAILGQGYYWPFEDPFGALKDEESAALAAIAREAAKRLAVPWIAIDIGQLNDGSWRVIETGDPQCSGLGHIAPRPFARALVKALAARA